MANTGRVALSCLFCVFAGLTSLGCFSCGIAFLFNDPASQTGCWLLTLGEGLGAFLVFYKNIMQYIDKTSTSYEFYYYSGFITSLILACGQLVCGIIMTQFEFLSSIGITLIGSCLTMSVVSSFIKSMNNNDDSTTKSEDSQTKIEDAQTKIEDPQDLKITNITGKAIQTHIPSPVPILIEKK